MTTENRPTISIEHAKLMLGTPSMEQLFNIRDWLIIKSEIQRDYYDPLTVNELVRLADQEAHQAYDDEMLRHAHRAGFDTAAEHTAALEALIAGKE